MIIIMKKTFFLALLTIIAISGFAKEKKTNAEKQSDFEKSLYEAIENRSFTFTAMTMKPSLGKVTPVDVPEKTVDVRPNHFMAEIVYDDVPTTAFRIPEYIVLDQPAYTYSVESNDKMYMVTVVLENIPKTAINPNSKYVFTFRIKKNSGSTTLEVKPDMSHEIKYVGSVMPK